MIQRRTWKDIPLGLPLPDGEGTMTLIVGTMPFRGLSYQFHGMTPDDVAEQAARWIQQSTGQDEVEPLVLIAGERNFILTKVGTSVVVSAGSTKPKVYR